MTIKEEFEKEYRDRQKFDSSMFQVALWSAKWMAEMCVKVVVVPGHPKIVKDIENQIRQLAKELD